MVNASSTGHAFDAGTRLRCETCGSEIQIIKACGCNPSDQVLQCCGKDMTAENAAQAADGMP